MWYVVSSSDGRQYPVTPQGITIGREGCTISIPQSDGKASRRHVIVRLQGLDIEVDDCDSTNGTYLDDYPVIGSIIWKQGVLLRCGDARFQPTYHPDEKITPIQYRQNVAARTEYAGPNNHGVPIASTSGYPAMQSSNFVQPRTALIRKELRLIGRALEWGVTTGCGHYPIGPRYLGMATLSIPGKFNQ